MEACVHFRSYLGRMILEWEMFQAKVTDKTKTLNWSSIKNYFFENRAVYEIIRKNTVQPGTPQIKIWRARNAFLIPKPTNTHSAYAILNVFPLQQWLHERASMLSCTHIACLVTNSMHSWFVLMQKPLQYHVSIHLNLPRDRKTS
jgi:hypothetical protein